MNNSRKIQPVVRKVTFTQAEEADDYYWANATEEERFNELADLRKMVFGSEEIGRIKKVVRKISLHGQRD